MKKIGLRFTEPGCRGNNSYLTPIAKIRTPIKWWGALGAMAPHLSFELYKIKQSIKRVK